jgi:Zn-dependent M28 family amino/carboxypeptidase
VLGAHYDGQGRTGQADPTRQTPPAGSPVDEIWNSANDNATSVAAVIEIARALKNSTQRPRRSILFAFFGAEEHGMTGSIYYVNHHRLPDLGSCRNDQSRKAGRSPERPFTVAGVMSSKAWTELVDGARSASGTKISPSPIAFPDSDHYPFGARGVPSILISVQLEFGRASAGDSADKIDFERTAEAAGMHSRSYDQLRTDH